MSTTCPVPDVPAPAGATAVDGWSDPAWPDQFRLFTGTTRNVERSSAGEFVEVQIVGTQLADGSIEERAITVYDPNDTHLTPGAARRLAAALVEAADELDRLS